jgi:hypothetical protein
MYFCNDIQKIFLSQTENKVKESYEKNLIRCSHNAVI